MFGLPDSTPTLDLAKIVTLDVETENVGADRLADSTRMISLQLGDTSKQVLYYADSPDPQHSLSSAKLQLDSLLAEEKIFSGYNLLAYDVPLIAKFLEIKIPQPNVFDLCQTKALLELGHELGRKALKLEDVCNRFGIATEHVKWMREKAEQYKIREDIISKAGVAAGSIAVVRGWPLQRAVDFTVENIARGRAILDAYNEFVSSGGKTDTLFYQYAIGKVVCEHRLLEALSQPEVVP